MMKKSAGILLLIVGLLFLAASSTPAAAESAYRMKIASVGSETHPSSLALAEVKKFIEEKSGKKIEVSLYLNSALGADRQITEGMQLGTIAAQPLSESSCVAGPSTVLPTNTLSAVTKRIEPLADGRSASGGIRTATAPNARGG